VGLGRVQVMR
jgi:transposase